MFGSSWLVVAAVLARANRSLAHAPKVDETHGCITVQQNSSSPILGPSVLTPVHGRANLWATRKKLQRAARDGVDESVLVLPPRPPSTQPPLPRRSRRLLGTLSYRCMVVTLSQSVPL